MNGTATAKRYINFLLENSIFLIVGTLLGLVWANVNLAGYESITHSLHFFVNDIAMAFFFGIAAKEVYEALLPGGALSSLRKAAMPLLAQSGYIPKRERNAGPRKQIGQRQRMMANKRLLDATVLHHSEQVEN